MESKLLFQLIGIGVIIFAAWQLHRHKTRRGVIVLISSILIFVPNQVWSVVRANVTVNPSLALGVDIGLMALAIIAGICFLWNVLKS